MHPHHEMRLRHLPTRHTPRLRLEPLKEAHAGALFPGLSDEALYEFIGERPPASVEALAGRYRRLEARMSPDGWETWLNWALWSVFGGGYVGVIQATVYPDYSAHIAYVVFHEAWGKGYAQEATAATIDHLRDDWGVHDVRAAVDVRNQRSIALLTRLGFQRIAVRRSAGMTRCAVSHEYVYRLRLVPRSSPAERSLSHEPAHRDPAPGGAPGEGAAPME